MWPRGVRIYAYNEPVDLRKSFDGLALLTQAHIGQDPQSGSLYCFVNKRKNREKILWWDTNGYCLLYKRLSGARFQNPSLVVDGTPASRIDAQQLALFLRGVVKKR